MKQRKEQVRAREGSGDLTPVHKYLVGRRRKGEPGSSQQCLVMGQETMDTA